MSSAPRQDPAAKAHPWAAPTHSPEGPGTSGHGRALRLSPDAWLCVCWAGLGLQTGARAGPLADQGCPSSRGVHPSPMGTAPAPLRAASAPIPIQSAPAQLAQLGAGHVLRSKWARPHSLWVVHPSPQGGLTPVLPTEEDPMSGPTMDSWRRLTPSPGGHAGACGQMWDLSPGHTVILGCWGTGLSLT